MSKSENELQGYVDEAKEEIEQSGMTCEDVWNLVDPYVEVEGDEDYEKIRADYIESTRIYKESEDNVLRLKGEMEVLEGDMNSCLPGGISQEMFTKHYEVVRDLHYAFGHYTAILQRRAASGVVFLEQIRRVQTLN